jgi:hypothetical protein
MDIVVGDDLVVEIKATDWVNPIHEAQRVIHLRLGGLRFGSC